MSGFVVLLDRKKGAEHTVQRLFNFGLSNVIT